MARERQQQQQLLRAAEAATAAAQGKCPLPHLFFLYTPSTYCNNFVFGNLPGSLRYRLRVARDAHACVYLPKQCTNWWRQSLGYAKEFETKRNSVTSSVCFHFVTNVNIYILNFIYKSLKYDEEPNCVPGTPGELRYTIYGCVTQRKRSAICDLRVGYAKGHTQFLISCIFGELPSLKCGPRSVSHKAQHTKCGRVENVILITCRRAGRQQLELEVELEVEVEFGYRILASAPVTNSFFRRNGSEGN